MSAFVYAFNKNTFSYLDITCKYELNWFIKLNVNLAKT